MNRYFLRLAYNGANFHGWQVQENAHTVQAELNKALSTQLQHEISCVGCGRTDTGVHALTYYVHFDCPKKIINNKQFLFKLNRILPADIAVFDVQQVAETTHARFDALSRTYQYYITKVKDPFLTGSAYYLYGELDIEKMNEAASFLMQYSDFAAFSKSGGQQETTLCKVTEAVWNQEESLLTFTITANRFLRNMVRAVVGTLIEIGKGKESPEFMHLLIQSGDRGKAGPSVPAHGLFLTDVTYKEGLIK